MNLRLIFDTYSWKGAENDPRNCVFSRLVSMPIAWLYGVDQNNKITAETIILTGWFTNSQQPGQDGLSIIAGHVTGKKGDKIFKAFG